MTLTRVAGRMRRAGMGKDEMMIALGAFNESKCVPPLSDEEVDGIVRSICRYEPDEPGNGGNEGNRNGGNPGNGPRFNLGSEVEIANHVCMEIEKGERMVYDRSKLWRYADTRGLWEEVDPTTVKRIVASFDGEMIAAGNDRNGNPRVRPLKVSNRLMEDVYKTVGVQRKQSDFFEKQKSGITFRNSFVWVDGDGIHQTEFSPLQRSINGLPFEFNKDALPFGFIRMLEGVFELDPDCKEKMMVIQEFLGVCLLNSATRFQKGVIFVGEGANGKSTVQEIMSALFGRGMITAVAPQEMEQEYRRAMLSTSRLNVVNELPEADILNSESVKAILAGDKVVGREIREAPFSFHPRAGHLFAANVLPGVRDMTRGFWRRWIVIQFNREFQEGQQDRTIAPRIIKSELPSIAAWALRGAVRVFETGAYTIPKSSVDALKEWRCNADQIAQFLDQKCEIKQEKGDEWTPSGNLYTAYSSWTIRNGHRGMSATKFGKRLSSLGVKKERRRAGMFWGLKVAGE